MKELDRFFGAVFGLLCGDALGTTLEFKSPGSFTPITDMNGGGPFMLTAGDWTDDGSMALCIIDSLIEHKGMNLEDQMERFIKWRDYGYMSSTGKCFDIGGTCNKALTNYKMNKDIETCGVDDEFSAGNGSLMRLVGVPLFFSNRDSNQVSYQCHRSSITTHAHQSCIDCCVFYGNLISHTFVESDKEKLLAFKPFHPLPDSIVEIANGSYKTKNPPEIKGSGYVIESMEAALWAFWNSNTFEEGCLMAANLGDDADTTAAIYGQLAGAFYGFDSLPDKWLDKITHYNMIESMIIKLYEVSRGN